MTARLCSQELINTTRRRRSETISSDSGRYVRLQRRGAIFHTYYSTKASDPTDESDWTELVPTGQIVSGADDVKLGPGGSLSGAAFGVITFPMIWNWEMWGT